MTKRVAPGELSDSVLIRRFLSGDEAAFRVLYQRHTPRLRMTVWRLLGQRSDETDDVVQETWLASCRSMHGFNGTAKFSTWLTSIAIRRAQSRFAAVPDEGTELFDVAAETSDSLTAIDLERAIARLSDRQRALVVLHDIEGFTHEEIAHQLGIPIGTSKVTLSRAREALRRMLPDGVFNVR